MTVTAGTAGNADAGGRVEARADTEPLIVDLGRKRRKLVKRLRRGEGKLLEDVMRCIQDLKDNGAITGAAQPVIVVVRERSKRSGSILPLAW